MSEHEGFDSVEQRDAYVEALRAELESCRQRGSRRVGDVEAELARFGVGGKSERAVSAQRRPRGAAAESRVKGGES